MNWTQEHLVAIEAVRELEIAVRGADHTLRPWTPIWVVQVAGEVYVRTWYRRATGWYGGALSTGRARIRVPGIEIDVTVEDIGADPRRLVDDAYRQKYGVGSAESMVTDEAAATTLRLAPV